MGDQQNSVVRRFRLRTGLTQEALAERSGVSVRTIRALENGTRRNPQLASLRQLADAMDLAPDERDELIAAALGTTPTSTAGVSLLPQQLPAAPRGFTGRDGELTLLSHAATDHAPTVVITVIAGAGGIGKTWLALHWAHLHAERFPDGQLFVDLLGFNPSVPPMEPATALRGFLETLGVTPNAIPSTPHGQAGLYRSLLADKRMLVVLDNACAPDQVVPLLPGSPTCTVVITSRRRLTALLTHHGAGLVTPDALSVAESRRVLTTRLGAERMAAESDAVEELLSWCAGYPLALGIVAGRAACRPQLPLARIAAELREATTRLDALDGDTPTASLPAVLSWSYDSLTTAQTRLFALLGLAPGPDIGLFAAASLAGLSTSVARATLRVLEDLHLVGQHAPDRWRMHDLVRLYAADRGRQNLSPHDRDAALRRLIEFYLHTACAADQLVETHHPPVRLDPEPDVELPQLATRAEAVEWFADELPNLLAAQSMAADRGWRAPVWQFASSLDIVQRRQGHVHDRLATWRAALDAVDHDDALDVRVLVHENLGHAAAHAGSHDEAAKHLEQALSLAEQTGDRGTQARIHVTLAQACGQHDHIRPALEHATRALRLHQEVDLPAAKAVALNSVGWYSARLGRYDQARVHCEAALRLARRVGHHNLEPDILDSLGYIAHHTGNHLEAVDHYRLAVVRYQAAGGVYFAADTLDRLGHAYRALGRNEQARAAWDQALAMYQDQRRHAVAEQVQRQLDALGDLK